MKKILIHTLSFSPDGVSTAYIYNDIALAFKKQGYDVVVLTSTPQSNLVEEQLKDQPLTWGVRGLYKTSSFKGIKVYHVPQKKFKSTALRLIGFVYWHFASLLIALSIKNLDVILSPSPPITLGRLNNLLGWLKGCKVIYNVQEIYPDILGLPERSFVNKVLRRMEKNVYNHSDAITTIDQVFYDTIAPRFKDKGKLSIIPNFVDTELYNMDANSDVLDRSLLPETDALKVMYAGNIGYAQDWDTLIELAKKTKDDNIEYFIIGGGVTKPYLQDKKKEFCLEKIHILDYQPRVLMPALLAYSDVQFIFMSQRMEHQGFPSKVYTVMACGKPLLISAATGTPLVNFLDGKECAKIVSECDMEKKSSEMANWLRQTSREEMSRLGANGLEEIQLHYTKEIVTGQYVTLIDSLIECNRQKDNVINR